MDERMMSEDFWNENLWDDRYRSGSALWTVERQPQPAVLAPIAI